MNASPLLYLSTGVFDKGGIARYNRFQVQALRACLGDEQVRVLSLWGPRAGDIEEQFQVDYAGAARLTAWSRVGYAGAAAYHALASRPGVILAAHINLGPLALTLARLSAARLVINVYARELWSGRGLRGARARALAAADLIISDCHNTVQWMQQAQVRTRAAPRVIWDCVDTKRYCPGAIDWDRVGRYGLRDTGRFRLLILGRITRDTHYKGFERLLQLLEQLPADRFEAVFAGKGDDVARLQARAREMGLGERVCFSGAIHEADMPALYRSADAFYLVSEVGVGMGEGIPLTPMEAMACGVPVLVGNQDGSRELLDSAGGWCGAPTDLAGQRAFVLALDADPARHAQARVDARARAKAAFDYQRFLTETCQAITPLGRAI